MRISTFVLSNFELPTVPTAPTSATAINFSYIWFYIIYFISLWRDFSSKEMKQIRDLRRLIWETAEMESHLNFKWGNSRKSCALSISLNLTAVRGRSYAEGAQRDSGASPLHLLCKCGVPASGGVRLIWYTSVSAHCFRLVARQSVKRSSGA